MNRQSVVGVFLVVCLALTYVLPREALYAAQMPHVPRPVLREKAPPTAAEKLGRALEELERDLRGRVAGGVARADRLGELGDRVAAFGDETLARLDAARDDLASRKLPPVALERHDEHRAHTARSLERLNGALGPAIAATASDQRSAAATRALEVLEELRGPDLHNAVDPARLPFRPHRAEVPRERAEAGAVDDKSASPLRITPEAIAPTPAELAEAIDVRFTPGLSELAAEVGGDTLSIYNWVRTNVEWVPTWGSIQGSEGCRRTLECNAHDAASLLIGLLRSSGVPARYATGRIELDPDTFANAAGDFADLEAALRFAASGGTPVSLVVDAAGDPVAVRMDHVWVEAWVDYVPSRGFTGGEGNAWVPLDPSIKPTHFIEPIDLEDALETDLQAFAEEVRASGTESPDGQTVVGVSRELAEARILELRDTLKEYAADRPDLTVGELVGGVELVAPPLDVLPATLPGRTLSVTGRVAELPAAVRHRVRMEMRDRFGLGASISVERSLSELAGSRITISFVPATEADQQTIEAYGGYYDVPPYLVSMLPTLMIDGEPVGFGGAVAMGTQLIFRVGFFEPGRGTDSVDHLITAGTYGALALDLQRISPRDLEEQRATYEEVRDRLVDLTVDSSLDELIGGALHMEGMSYFSNVGLNDALASHRLGVAALKRPAEGLVTFAPGFASIFGSATDITSLGYNIDVRRYVVSTAARNGDPDRERSYLFATGSYGSAAEHGVFELNEGVESVSAVKLLDEASSRQIPIHSVTAANVDSVLPQLGVSSGVIQDVRNSVAAGKVVLIPEDDMQFFDWRGVGYIVMDPDTGAAGYLISGGLAGGGTAQETESSDLWSKLLAGVSWLANALGGWVAFFQSGSKVIRGIDLLDSVASVFGWIMAGLSAVATAIDSFDKTDSLVAALIAGAIDLLASYLVGLFAAWLGGLAFFTGLWGLIATIAIIVIVSIIVFFIVQWLVGLVNQLFSSLRVIRRRDQWADDLGGGFAPGLAGAALAGGAA